MTAGHHDIHAQLTLIPALTGLPGTKQNQENASLFPTTKHGWYKESIGFPKTTCLSFVRTTGNSVPGRDEGRGTNTGRRDMGPIYIVKFSKMLREEGESYGFSKRWHPPFIRHSKTHPLCEKWWDSATIISYNVTFEISSKERTVWNRKQLFYTTISGV